MALRIKLTFSQLFSFFFLLLHLDENKIDSSFEIQAPHLVKVQCQTFTLFFSVSLLGIGQGGSVCYVRQTPQFGSGVGTPWQSPLRYQDLGPTTALTPGSSFPHSLAQTSEQMSKQISKEQKLSFLVSDSCRRG